jgi:hypothetical protein
MKRAFLFILLFTFGGCASSTDVFVFDCVIQNALNNAPLEGVAIVLQGQRVTGGSFNPNFQTLGTATTDANGHFVLEVDKELFNAYRLNISLPQYFNKSVAISPDDVPLSTAYTNTFSLEPEAWVSTRIRNTSESQHLDVTINGSSDNSEESCNALHVIHEGTVFDTTLVCRMYGNRLVATTGNYRNSDGQTIIISNQYTSVAFDTLHINLTY